MEDEDNISMARLFQSRKKLTTPLQRALYRPTLLELLTSQDEEGGVIVEDVAVILKAYGPTKVMISRVYPLVEVQKFKMLVDRKKATGLKLTSKDGALAVLITALCGTVSQITGFLRAISIHYPEFKDERTGTVGQVLSRLATEGIIGGTQDHVAGERIYCLSIVKQKELLYKERWW